MNSRAGNTLVEAMIIIMVVFIVLCVTIGGCFNKHIIGNKQYFDFRQNFKYAYITEGTNVVKYEIKAWKDWKGSDSVQIITIDDKAIYTHLNRVLLTDK